MAKETPFNVDLIKADSFGGSKRGLGPTRDKTVKFFAWPKRPAYGKFLAYLNRFKKKNFISRSLITFRI